MKVGALNIGICWIDDDTPNLSSAAMTITKVQDIFGLGDPDLQWQELKLRPFTFPEGKCWNRTGRRLGHVFFRKPPGIIWIVDRPGREVAEKGFCPCTHYVLLPA